MASPVQHIFANVANTHVSCNSLAIRRQESAAMLVGMKCVDCSNTFRLWLSGSQIGVWRRYQYHYYYYYYFIRDVYFFSRKLVATDADRRCACTSLLHVWS